MNQVTVPQGYSPKLCNRDLQLAIDLIRRTFQEKLSQALNLKRVSAPLFVNPQTGVNDNLSGVERPVAFDIPAIGIDAEIVHSLAKWKRVALSRYGFAEYEGLFTDMNAIRRDEELDNIHSVYVDQWDWEKVMAKEDRTVDYLKSTVQRIVDAICNTQKALHEVYGPLTETISNQISFVTSQELEDTYPTLTPKQREYEYVKEHKTAFIMNIGGKLKSGKPHDGRAPDYDDWALNGDIIVWNPVLEEQLELSSMGIRVSPESLRTQLAERGVSDWLEKPFHKMLSEGILPDTIGGGIGQSRLCMRLLGKAHIGEVQSSVWDVATVEACEQRGIELL